MFLSPVLWHEQLYHITLRWWWCKSLCYSVVLYGTLAVVVISHLSVHEHVERRKPLSVTTRRRHMARRRRRSLHPAWGLCSQHGHVCGLGFLWVWNADDTNGVGESCTSPPTRHHYDRTASLHHAAVPTLINCRCDTVVHVLGPVIIALSWNTQAIFLHCSHYQLLFASHAYLYKLITVHNELYVFSVVKS